MEGLALLAEKEGTARLRSRLGGSRACWRRSYGRLLKRAWKLGLPWGYPVDLIVLGGYGGGWGCF